MSAARTVVPIDAARAGGSTGGSPLLPEHATDAPMSRDPEQILDSISSGVAVADPSTWTIRYENARFSDWFPPDVEAAGLAGRLRGADLERAGDRVRKGRPYRWETEVTRGPRAINLMVEIRGERVGGADVVVIEAQNIAKQKEAEFMLDSYSRLVERQTRELEQEKERAEKLLLNIMPRRIYEELKDYGTTTPQSFDRVSVLMLDFAGFTEMAIARDPTALIAELNDVFTSFDRIVEHFRGERIKTIGDAYMAVSGVPEPDPDHARHMARVALRMRRFLERRNQNSPTEWRCRIGIGAGPVIGSIVGVQKYVYDIFGTAVNMASRLEALADPMQILVCPATAEALRDAFIVSEVGQVDIKGFGMTTLYSLDDEARKGR